MLLHSFGFFFRKVIFPCASLVIPHLCSIPIYLPRVRFLFGPAPSHFLTFTFPPLYYIFYPAPKFVCEIDMMELVAVSSSPSQSFSSYRCGTLRTGCGFDVTFSLLDEAPVNQAFPFDLIF